MMKVTSVFRSSMARKVPVRWASGKNYVVLGDSSSLDQIVESPESKVLYFTATWCPPCKMIAPVFEKLSKDFPQTKFVKIDIDAHSDSAAEFQIRSVPTFLFYKGSTMKEQFSGANENMLRQSLEKIQ